MNASERKTAENRTRDESNNTTANISHITLRGSVAGEDKGSSFRVTVLSLIGMSASMSVVCGSLSLSSVSWRETISCSLASVATGGCRTAQAVEFSSESVMSRFLSKHGEWVISSEWDVGGI